MRILVLLTDGFGGHGGIAKFNRDLLTALCTYPNCKEVIAIPRLMQNSPEPFPEKLIYVTEGLNSRFKYLTTVFKVIKSNPRFDLIICGHIHLLPAAYLARFFHQGRSSVVLIMHGIDAWQSTGRALTDYLVKKVNAFISVSEFTKEHFLSWTGLNKKSFFILPNCVDIASYGSGHKRTELVQQYGLQGKVVLMTLGRLASADRYKGFDEILELMPELIKEIPNLMYLIVGDGNDRKRLEEKARSLGVAGHVIFTGFILESEKADHYRLADAYVMPGRGEGFGIVYLEAMACGIPVVASKADGSREAVRNGALGVLVDPDNKEEIKAGILEALERPKGIISTGLDYFSFKNFQKRCHFIIDQVLGLEIS